MILLKNLPVPPYGICLLTLGAPLPSEGHYGQMAELLVLQSGLIQAFSFALG